MTWKGIILALAIPTILGFCLVGSMDSYNQRISNISLDILEENMLNKEISPKDCFLINEMVKRHTTENLMVKNVDVVDCRGDSQKRKWEIVEEYYHCWYSGSSNPDDSNSGCYFIQNGEAFSAYPISQLEGKLPEYIIMIRMFTFWSSKFDVTESGISVHVGKF